MSQLRVCSPVELSKIISSSCADESAAHPHMNLFYGSSAMKFETAGVETQTDIIVDAGSGNTIGVDFLYLRGVDLLVSAGGSGWGVSLIGSSDNFASINVTKFSFTNLETQSGDPGNKIRIGGRLDSLIQVSDTVTAYRYWKLRIVSGSSKVHRLRKALFGKTFAFDRDPSYPYGNNFSPLRSPFQSDGGSTYLSSDGRRQRVLEFEWKGVTDALRDEWESTIGRFQEDLPLILWQPHTADHSPIGNEKLVIGYAETNFNTGDWKNINTMRLQFIEDAP